MQKRIVVLSVLLFCSVLSQNAWARTDLGWRSLGVDFGFVDPENVNGTVGFGAFADLGNLSPDIKLQPHVNYWSKSEEFFGETFTIRDIAFSTRALYMFRGTSPKFRPYAGGGLGLHFVNAKVEVPGMGEVSDSETKLGIDLGGGFSTPIGARTDFCADLFYTAMSDVGHISMKAGISFDLGGSPSESRTPERRPSPRSRSKH